VNFTKNECAAESPQSVSGPIARVISGAILEERLMELVPDSHEGKSDGNDENEVPPFHPWSAEVERCCQQSATAEEVAKVGYFIEMRNVEKEAARGLESVSVREQIQKEKPEEEGQLPETGAAGEIAEGEHCTQLSSPLRRISSSIRSESHCFIMDW